MLLKSVLTSALLALSLGSEAAEASKSSKFGRLSQLVRAPLEHAERAVQAAHRKPVRCTKDFRFLSDKTKRE